MVQAYIDRISEVQPVLNAVVERRFEDALREAAKADDLVRARTKTPEELAKEFPLLGVPFTVKNSIGVKGKGFLVSFLPSPPLFVDHKRRFGHGRTGHLYWQRVRRKKNISLTLKPNHSKQISLSYEILHPDNRALSLSMVNQSLRSWNCIVVVNIGRHACEKRVSSAGIVTERLLRKNNEENRAKVPANLQMLSDNINAAKHHRDGYHKPTFFLSCCVFGLIGPSVLRAC